MGRLNPLIPMKHHLYLLLITLTGCATLPHAISASNPTNKVPEQHVHVASHGWHTGIIVDGNKLNRRMPSLADRFPKAEFYEIGWGDAGFYQADKITATLTLNAVFLPSDTVVHVVGFEGNPAMYFPTSEVRSVSLTDEGMERLCEFIESSFAKDQAGEPIRSSVGLYGDSQFYQGEGKYHLLNGCNKWTAKALCSGGVAINPALKITSASVMDEIRLSAEPPTQRVKRKRPR